MAAAGIYLSRGLGAISVYGWPKIAMFIPGWRTSTFLWSWTGRTGHLSQLYNMYVTFVKTCRPEQDLCFCWSGFYRFLFVCFSLCLLRKRKGSKTWQTKTKSDTIVKCPTTSLQRERVKGSERLRIPMLPRGRCKYYHLILESEEFDFSKRKEFIYFINVFLQPLDVFSQFMLTMLKYFLTLIFQRYHWSSSSQISHLPFSYWFLTAVKHTILYFCGLWHMYGKVGLVEGNQFAGW